MSEKNQTSPENDESTLATTRDPRDTTHPTGKEQADQNAEDESPA